jgi:carbon-monoxide dehydrogenase medium subunit
MKPNELLVRVEFPGSPEGVRAVALELSRRRGDYAIVGLLAQARIDGGAMTDLATAFFGVSDRPIRIPGVEDGLARGSIEDAHAAVEQALEPEGDLYNAPATKRHLAKVLVSRAAAQLSH